MEDCIHFMQQVTSSNSKNLTVSLMTENALKIFDRLEELLLVKTIEAKQIEKADYLAMLDLMLEQLKVHKIVGVKENNASV